MVQCICLYYIGADATNRAGTEPRHLHLKVKDERSRMSVLVGSE